MIPRKSRVKNWTFIMFADVYVHACMYVERQKIHFNF